MRAAGTAKAVESAESPGKESLRGAILIVDDDRNHAEGIADVLERVRRARDVEVRPNGARWHELLQEQARCGGGGVGAADVVKIGVNGLEHHRHFG